VQAEAGPGRFAIAAGSFDPGRPCRGGEDLLRRLFEPLGHEIAIVPHVLDETFPDWGDQLEFLRKLVAELGLHEKVLFKGSLVVEELVRVMENADLGIVPKRKNGFGNEAFSTKIPEFMAMGVPVVIPNTDIDKYYFDDSVAKFFVAGDRASLAEAMLTMIRDADLRQRLAQNASAFVQNFSWEKNQALYLDVVRGLLETRGT
jgi:glycosyltransferase involved in cell wall biosynthesis